MAAEGKWIEGLSADTRWSDACSLILEARLNAVENNWQLALDEKVSPEPVHQLRVSTRRARAALHIFEDILPKRVCSDMNRMLKKLRNIVGTARDWDVFNVKLVEWSFSRPDSEQPGLDFLSGMATGRRKLAQKDLDKSIDHQGDWAKQIPKLKPRRGKKTKLGDRAPVLVQDLLADFQHSTEVEITDSEQLHQVRIAGKRLRYALELFVDVLGGTVRDQYLPKMEEVQDILGDANDARNLKDQISEMMSFLPHLGSERMLRYAGGIETWCDQLAQDAAGGLPKFLEWRRSWQDAVTQSG